MPVPGGPKSRTFPPPERTPLNICIRLSSLMDRGRITFSNSDCLASSLPMMLENVTSRVNGGTTGGGATVLLGGEVGMVSPLLADIDKMKCIASEHVFRTSIYSDSGNKDWLSSTSDSNMRQPSLTSRDRLFLRSSKILSVTAKDR